ncbi:DNA-binding transcriptional ArsR family regulator [Kitasatospora gansuensis]|uniref:DNA-binding transcriptional ArsR family regulator n=1 Tax=Kitasatospora gansuensis TaxID=258050 RepID=A0A7W7WFN4_9ACTN|nr:metalloregulator ArsR/SmtB family transcription factor [Kitasatospora gansuensis]MBB4945957.1 DNA-binding transcriptional ArsR family regulator [Kitasatospora gansuensis]
MGAQVQPWDAAGAERAVAVLKAVADPARYRLLWALSGAELPVSALAELLGAHVAATSQHLAKLRAAGLVDSRREGTRIFYRAAEGPDVRGLLEAALLVGQAAAGKGDEAAVAGELAAAKARVGRALAPKRVPEHRPKHA